MNITIMGVPLKFHWTYSILFFLLVYLFSPVVACLYLLSQILHEYSHVWVGQLFGWEASKVVISAGGAAAYISYPWEVSMKEFWVAFAGPAMSLLLTIFSYFLWKIYPSEDIMLWFVINAISIFNLLPIYPSDGGRMLHVIVAKIFGRERALRFSRALSISISLFVFACFMGLLLLRIL